MTTEKAIEFGKIFLKTIENEKGSATYEFVEMAVKMMEQESKSGHWIGQKKIGLGEWKDCIVPLKDGYVTGSCSCSECGEWLTGSDEYQCSGNYCPNCGCRMEGSE